MFFAWTIRSSGRTRNNSAINGAIQEFVFSTEQIKETGLRQRRDERKRTKMQAECWIEGERCSIDGSTKIHIDFVSKHTHSLAPSTPGEAIVEDPKILPFGA
jgi:hypothetical protein